MPPKAKKQSKTPSRTQNSEKPASPRTPLVSSLDSELIEDDLNCYIEEASRRYPSLIGKSAFIGRVNDVESVSKGCKIWLSEASMVSASLAPGSLVSVSILVSDSKFSNSFPLSSISDDPAEGSNKEVGNYFALAAVFPSSKIWMANSLEELFHPHHQSQSVMETPVKIVFSNLAYMYLDTAPKLKCFLPQIHTIECPSMTELYVNGCDPMFASEFPSLQSRKEDNCSLFWVTKGTFPVLNKLTLAWSESMEEIWHGQHPQDYFPELQVIQLNDYPEQLVEPQSLFFQSLPKLEKLVVEDEVKAFKNNVEEETGQTCEN